MKKVVSLLLSMIMMFSIIGSVDLSAYASSSEEEYQTYLADYLLENSVAQDYLAGKNALPYRMYVEQRRNNPAFNSLLAAWRIGTFSLSDVTQYADKEVGYYQAILFDILLTDDNGSSLFDDIDNLTDSINASSFKKIYTLYSKIMDPNDSKLDVNSQEYKNFMKASKELKGLSEAFKLIDNFDKYYSYCKNSADFIKKCSQVQAVAVNYTMLGDILTDISNKTNNPALKIACTNMRGIIENAVGTLLVENIFILGKGAKIIADDILGTIWDKVVDSCIGYGYAIKAGQAMGKLASNLLFATEKDLEHVYAMYALYDFENLLTECVKVYQSSYKSNRTIQNAYKYNEAYKLFLKVQLEGAEYSREFVKICCDEGLLNNVYKYFNQDDYNTFMQYILNAENMIKSYIYFINTNVYNSFIDIYRENADSSILNAIDTSKKTQYISQDKYDESVSYIKEVSTKYYGLNFNKATTLSEDIVTYSDCYISDDVDLNGHILTINGDLLHSAGLLKIGVGTLDVKGDYRNAIKIVDEYGKVTYDTSHGYLNMNHENGTMHVGNDFLWKGWGSSNSQLSAGKLIVSGNFYQNGGFNTSEGFKFILKGDKIHEVYFESDSSYITNLETEENARVKFTGKLCGFTLTQDLTVEGDMELSNGTLDLNGHTLTVNGDLLHSDGLLKIGMGTLDVKGDYRQASKIVDEYGKVTYDTGDGILNMNHENGTMHVGNDFLWKGWSSSYSELSAGKLIVAGNFYQNKGEYPNNFSTSDSFKFILKGDKIHEVYFESDSSYITNLETEENAKVKFTGKLRGFTLTQDLTVEGDMELSAGTLDLNGHTLTVNGNLLHSGGTLKIGMGTLDVKGDYRISKKYVDEYYNVTYGSTKAYLNMNNEAGVINIAGNFITRSSQFFNDSTSPGNVLTAGAIIIGGDFYQYADEYDSRYCKGFPSSGTHKVVFAGNKTHKIYFDVDNWSAASHFCTLETVGNSKLEFTGEFSGFALTQDLIVEGDIELSAGTLDLNGHTLTVNGNLLHSGGTLKIGMGTLDVKGDYRNASKIVDEYGKVTYGTGDGILNMNHENGTMHVGNNFLWKSYKDDHSALSAGRLIVSGNFYQNNGGSYSDNFSTSDSFKFILKGDKIHEVYFESDSSYITNLETEENAKVKFTGKLRGFTLTQDLTVEGDMELSAGTLDLNGHTLTVNGDLNIKSDIDINAGVLIVNGNVLHSSGKVYIHNGTLDIAGNYRLQNKSVDNIGNITYSSSNGYLSMICSNDILNVAGDIYLYGKSSTLSNGTLNLSGNLTTYNSNTKFSDSHLTVLNGAKKQSIKFSSTGDKFNMLLLTRDMGNYEFNPANCWVKLIETDIVLPIVSSITVNTMPTKTTYIVGELFSLSGFSIKVKMSDGATKTITSGFIIETPDLSTAGVKTVTVTYEGKTTTFNITVQESVDTNLPTIYAEDVVGKAGDTISVSLFIKNNPGVAYTKLKVAYGKELQLISATNHNVLSGTFTTSQSIDVNPYVLQWMDAGNSTGNGCFVTLTFKISDMAEEGIYNLTVTCEEAYNQDLEDVKFSIVSPTVSVKDYTPGDLNDDGKVNGKDGILLSQYLAEWDVSINLQAADVNKDGKINGKDGVILSQYLAEWDVTLG